MAYCRFGQDGSDVYLFGGRGWNGEEAFDCCGCLLRPMEWVDDSDHFLGGYLSPLDPANDPGIFLEPSRQKVLDHLREHLAAGHNVPDYVFTAIWEETEWGQP